MSHYDFTAVESKWQSWWAAHQTFKTPNPGDPGFDPAKPKFFVLDMFPYPSGVGLHVGHPLGYIATDIVARHKRMLGCNVLHPMGYDAFGLPAEQFAIEHGVHPRVTTETNIANMTRQLKRLGLGYDWDRQIATIEPDYYKWTQWIFLQIFNSWFDPFEKKARPIAELIGLLESGELLVGPDGEIAVPMVEGLEAITGLPPGCRKFQELDELEQHDFVNNQRLAYLDEVPVNWCPALGTVLANEEVTADGRSERGNHPVFRRPLKQWMLRITAYAQRLADDLDLVNWPESLKLLQRNWIGRSEGARVLFEIEDKPGETIEVFTTRPDTLFGATYMVLAPEHPLVDEVTTAEHRQAVKDYQQQAARRSEMDRTTDAKAKTGVFTGAHAINPVNQEAIPIWIADYVMMGYGTGAIMAVPAHDERDFDFAREYELPIRDVVATPVIAAIYAFFERWDRMDSPREDGPDRLADFVGLCMNQAIDDFDGAFQTVLTRRDEDADHEELLESGRGTIATIWQDALPQWPAGLARLAEACRNGELISLLGDAESGEGIGVNSAHGELSINGMKTRQAKAEVIRWLEQHGAGRRRVQYKLRDWLFSRQRYWGEPFPILHGPDGRIAAVDESDLPVLLPEMDDFRPEAGDDPEAPPKPPLARADASWREVERDGVRWQRELNTMPQWAGSCWYYLRYLDPKCADRMVGSEAEEYWMKPAEGQSDGSPMGVDLYVGGVEHAVLHLLYARFWHKVLYDLGHVSTTEPFGRLFNQGYIQAYAYFDERGMYVPADEVEEKAGGFFHQGKPVRREFGKMGKSLKNAVAPDEVCDQYGCDTLRLYEMYLGPLDQSKIWNTRDIVGVHRFLHRLWRNFIDDQTGEVRVTDQEPPDELLRAIHKTIDKVSHAMNGMAFNVAIAALIEMNNLLVNRPSVERVIARPMLQLLAPMAPHICEELWQRIGGEPSIADQPWPKADPAMLVDAEIEMPVQVNGKLRGRIKVAADADQAAVEQAARNDAKIMASLEGRTVRKVIIVPKKLVNIVVG